MKAKRYIHRFNTGVRVKPKNWNPAKLTTDHDSNQKLKAYERAFEQEIRRLAKGQYTISYAQKFTPATADVQTLKHYFSGTLKAIEAKKLSDYFQEYIDVRINRGTKPNTLKGLVSAKKRLEKFEETL